MVIHNPEASSIPLSKRTILNNEESPSSFLHSEVIQNSLANKLTKLLNLLPLWHNPLSSKDVEKHSP